MTATLQLSNRVRTRLGNEAPSAFYVEGDIALMNLPLLGLLCSRTCPGSVILETLDRVPEWIKAGHVIVSGFHGPLEQQVLRSLLRREGRAVKVLARALEGYRPTPGESEAIASSRLLLISPFDSKVRRTTRETALTRNRLVAALSHELIVPYAAPGSALAEIAALFEGFSNAEPAR